MSTSSLLLNLLVEGLVQGCIYALMAVGFSLLWWVSGIVHLAHGGVTLAGGLMVFLALDALGAPFALSLMVGGASAIGLGLLINSAIYSPLLARQTDEMGLLTASLGALIVIEYVLTITFRPRRHHALIRHLGGVPFCRPIYRRLIGFPFSYSPPPRPFS